MTKEAKLRPELAQTELSELISYCPDTGMFTWAPNRPLSVAGKVAGSVDLKGYTVIRVLGKLHKAHRLAWFIVTGEWPEQVDHIDGNRSNNKFENLREATQAENAQNRGVMATNKSGVTGVFWASREGKWGASHSVNGKHVSLGRFTNFDEAVKARLEAKAKTHLFHPGQTSRAAWRAAA